MDLPPELLAALVRLQKTIVKRDDRVLFIGHKNGRFAGNVKYLFLHMVRHAPELNPVYLTYDERTRRELDRAGLPVLRFPAAESLPVVAEAGTVIVDDFNFKQSPVSMLIRGARIIQLWHGVGFKKIGFLEADAAMDKGEEFRQRIRGLYSGYDAVISTSPFYTQELFKTSFGTKAVWETGYPRNDVFFRAPNKFDLLHSDPALYSRLKHSQDRFIFLYMPTFRDRGTPDFSTRAFDLPALDEALGKMRATMLVKLHPSARAEPGFQAENILYCDRDSDVYPLLPLTHCLVTDYSSIYTDYLTMGKPVIFYCYDIDEYLAVHRELQFEYGEVTPGPKVFDQDELLDALRAVQNGDEDPIWTDFRDTFGRLAFSNHDGDSAKRVLDLLRSQLST